MVEFPYILLLEKWFLFWKIKKQIFFIVSFTNKHPQKKTEKLGEFIEILFWYGDVILIFLKIEIIYIFYVEYLILQAEIW